MEEGTRHISNGLASTYYIDLTRKIMVKGADLIFVQQDLKALILMAVFFYLASILLFKKRLG